MRAGRVAAKQSGFKRIFERTVEGMAKALLVKAEQAFAGHAEMATLLALRRIDFGGGQVAAVNEIANGLPGSGEEFRYRANFDERRNWIFGGVTTNCNHNVYLSWVWMKYKKEYRPCFKED